MMRFVERIQTGSFMVHETSSATRTRDSYYNPAQILGHDNRPNRHYEQSDYGNDRVGWGRTATESWTFDRDRAGYAGQFIWTGFDYIGEPTPWHNQDNTPVKSSYLVSSIRLVYQKMISTFIAVSGIVLKKSQLYAFYHIGTGLKRHLRIARC